MTVVVSKSVFQEINECDELPGRSCAITVFRRQTYMFQPRKTHVLSKVVQGFILLVFFCTQWLCDCFALTFEHPFSAALSGFRKSGDFPRNP